jgi:hypothetical protein
MSTHVFFKLEFPKVDPDFPTTIEVVIKARHQGTWLPMTSKIVEPHFDNYINDLIKELEQIRQEGKRKFAAAKNKLRKLPT